MHKPHSVPLSASMLSFIVLLHASSICAKNEFNKRKPQGNVEQPPSPVETIVIGHSSFAVDPTHIIINSTTVAPTLPGVTINHATISVDRSNNVFINGSEANVGIPTPPQTTAYKNSSGLSKSFDVTSLFGPSGSPGLLGSPTLSPTNTGIHSASNVSSRSDSGLAGSGTASTRYHSDSLLTGPGVASTGSGSIETSRLSTQSGLLISPESVSLCVPAISRNSSSIPFGTGASFSSFPRAGSVSQGGSEPVASITATSSSQSQAAPATSKNATASITSILGSTPAPGSIGNIPGPSATSASTGTSAGPSTGTSGSSSITSFDVRIRLKPVESLSLRFLAVEMQHRRKNLFLVVCSSDSLAVGAVG